MPVSTYTPAPTVDTNGRQSCPNCNAALTCSCQKKVASNGKAVCVHCLYHYENSLQVTNR
jgi:hypothetical protein